MPTAKRELSAFAKDDSLIYFEIPNLVPAKSPYLPPFGRWTLLLKGLLGPKKKLSAFTKTDGLVHLEIGRILRASAPPNEPTCRPSALAQMANAAVERP